MSVSVHLHKNTSKKWKTRHHKQETGLNPMERKKGKNYGLPSLSENINKNKNAKTYFAFTFES